MAIRPVRLPGRVLNQRALKMIHNIQKQGEMTTVAIQKSLKKTFLAGVAANHPKVSALPYDLKKITRQTIDLTKELLERYNIGKFIESFKKLAPKATAGLRENFDVLDWNNPNYMYNPVFMMLLIEAEGRFIHEQHQIKSEKMKNMDLKAKALEVEQALPQSTIKAVMELFGGRSIVQILELLRDKPLKIMAKEVRPQTDHMLELEARIMAEKGITVLTTDKFTDTTCIYLNSFLCFLLGSDAGTYYSPSHSSVYILGRKVLAGDGAQLLPEVYDRFIELLVDVYQEAMEKGYAIKIGRRDDPNILNNITYERAAVLFTDALAPSAEAIESINRASKSGLKMILNTLSGSGAKSLAAQFKALGINTSLFKPMWAREDSFFNAGYVVAEKNGRYFVDHLGVDTTSQKVVRQIPYVEALRGVKPGTFIVEVDPDTDRLVVKQVLKNNLVATCEKLGIDYYDLPGSKILAAPSPNKMFLLLDIADYERMKASGEWKQFKFLYFPTYVSSAAWVEFGKWLERSEGNIATFLCRVGFKNFNQALAQIQDWWFNRPGQSTLNIQPQLGNSITLDRSKPLRVLSKEEESGGRASGFPKPVMNLLGEKILSLPEKAVGDAIMAFLAEAARRYNSKQEMRLPYVIAEAFKKYGIVSVIDSRLDILHGNQGLIAQVSKVEGDKLKAHAGAEKSNFNNFFFSIGKALKDKKLSLEKAKEILSSTLPQWKETWDCLDEINYVEEELTPGVFRPEGVMMTFSKKGDKEPLVTAFKFRPSGTDPLKSKIYIDAETLSSNTIAEIEGAFNNLKGCDLYSVLDRFGLAYVESKPSEISEIGLKPI